MKYFIQALPWKCMIKQRALFPSEGENKAGIWVTPLRSGVGTYISLEVPKSVSNSYVFGDV